MLSYLTCYNTNMCSKKLAKKHAFVVFCKKMQYFTKLCHKALTTKILLNYNCVVFLQNCKNEH